MTKHTSSVLRISRERYRVKRDTYLEEDDREKAQFCQDCIRRINTELEKRSRQELNSC